MFEECLNVCGSVCVCGGGGDGGFLLRTTSVSPLDRDKDTLSLTRKTGERLRRFSVTENKMEETGMEKIRIA